ncbi:hypothetical protein ABPG72_002054 [Tetrahymena utriculariae]
MKNFDIFGSQVQFRFQGSKSYSTSLGVFFTISITAILLFRLVFMVNDIQNRINPTVIQKERQVDSPEKFVMNPKTLPLAFGMQDGVTYNHYIDPTIYNVVAYQLTKVTTYDDQGQPQYQFQQTNVTVQRCTEHHFQNAKTKYGFLSLPYESLYCIDPQFEEIIEGDYSQQNFQQFVIQVYPCVGQGCGNTTSLGKGYFAIYFQDVVVDPEIKDEPFRFYNRDLFWTTSLQSPRDLNMYFRNNYIESDYGWITPDIQTVRYISYNYQDLSFTSGVDYFLQLILRFEKQKENVYSRKYKNLTNVISEMGGFAQSMLAIGFILCTTFSDLMLNKSIINDAFDFKITEFNKKSKDQKFLNQNFTQNDKDKQIQLTNNNPKKINNHSPALQSVIENQDQSELKTNIKENQPNQISQLSGKKSKKVSFNKIDFNPNLLSNDNLICQDNSQIQTKKLQTPTQRIEDQLKRQNNQAYLSQIIKKKTLIPTERQGQNEKDQLNQLHLQNTRLENSSTKKKITNEQFKKLLCKEKNSMQLSIAEYIKYFFWPFGSVKKKKQIIDYSIQKLYYHLDVIYIVKKLLEVDKLKQLIMDKDQIQLFEYISKPLISDEDVFGKQNVQNLQEQQEKYSILYQDNRSDIQKAQDAYQSYQSIQKRDLSAMDKKILNHLDPQLVNIFNYQEQKEISQRDQQLANPSNTIENNNLNELQKQNSENQFYNQLSSPKSIDQNLEDNYFENIDVEEQIPIETEIQNKINFIKTSQPQSQVKKAI